MIKGNRDGLGKMTKEEIKADPELLDACLDMALDTFGPCVFQLEGGEVIKRELSVYLVGKFFCNLEMTRDIVGHTSVMGTLYYIHDMTPECRFVCDVIERAAGRRSRRG